MKLMVEFPGSEWVDVDSIIQIKYLERDHDNDDSATIVRVRRGGDAVIVVDMTPTQVIEYIRENMVAPFGGN